VSLTKAEEEQLEELLKKKEAPELERREVVEIKVDLSDREAVRRAVACGYLDESLLDELERPEDEDEHEKRGSVREKATRAQTAKEDKIDRRFG
jgi:hypothetical protein